MKQSIQNFQALETEIYREQLRAKMLEDRMDQQVNHFKKHYRTMIVNSIFRKETHEEENSGSWLQAILQHESVQHSMGKVADHLAEKASDKLNALIDRLMKK